MDPFIYFAVAIASLVLALLGFRLTGLGGYSWVIAATMIAIVLTYPLVWYGSLSEKVDSIVRSIIHFDMAVVSILLGLTLIRDLIFLPLKFINPGFSRVAFSFQGTLIVFFITVIFLIYGYWNAARGPTIVEIEIPIPSLPKELEDFSIVQISDLHAGAGIDQPYVQGVVDMTVSLAPSLVVLTGDIGDGKFDRFEKHVNPLRELAQKSPVLYVTGNHEYIKDSLEWTQKFKDLGMQMLLNQNIILEHQGRKILIAGVIDPAAAEVNANDGPDLAKVIADSSLVDLKILLAHQPKIAVEAEGHFDLQLSGHTHGGQFFPWNLVIHVVQKFSRGLYRYKTMWVYVNVGTGYWGPPLRIGTRSEITRVKLRRLEE